MCVFIKFMQSWLIISGSQGSETNLPLIKVRQSFLLEYEFLLEYDNCFFTLKSSLRVYYEKNEIISNWNTIFFSLSGK